MYKILILLYLYGVVKSEKVPIEWFSGEWTMAVEYPPETRFKPCLKDDIQVNNNLKCSCGDKETNVFNMLILPETQTLVTPAIIVNSSTELHDAINIQCKCEDKIQSPIVLRKINENCFILYSDHRAEDQPNKAYVMMKKLPKLSELQDLLKNIDDLSQRTPGFLCKSKYFVNEVEELDKI